MKYIEVSSMAGVCILKIKNIDVLSCHAPNIGSFKESRLHHIKIQLKRGEPIVLFYQTEEKMMEEYRVIKNNLFNT